ncbi:hypothetical protein BDQ12DRAFT_676307 [Crucibulum laeve]|uniref:DUF6699 domain-containing protein n=1 Tax=Crucibulum laeve TaxID=68775 RepID=A0A5C3MB02_9AGAR|nr:hypothetical protein BDQ12DRAFT_676307 [Crucibulum laeve]
MPPNRRGCSVHFATSVSASPVARAPNYRLRGPPITPYYVPPLDLPQIPLTPNRNSPAASLLRNSTFRSRPQSSRYRRNSLRHSSPYSTPRNPLQHSQPKTWYYQNGNIRWSPKDVQAHAHLVEPLRPGMQEWEYTSGTLRWDPTPIPYVQQYLQSNWNLQAYEDTYDNNGHDLFSIHADLQPANMSWDIMRRPKTARAAPALGRTQRPQFAASALPEGVEEVTLACSTPPISRWIGMWGPIILDRASDKGGVMVEEILDAIHEYFHTPITAAEWAIFSRSPQVYTSYVRRLGMSRTFPQGYSSLRIDILCGYSYFGGLRLHSFHDGHAKLYFDLLPEPCF